MYALYSAAGVDAITGMKGTKPTSNSTKDIQYYGEIRI
jgi:hypothetical protein